MKKFLLNLFVLIGLALSAYAQTTTIQGKVVDADGAVIGANVLIKGTTSGTITDVNGSYNFKTSVSGNQILTISFVGYETLETPVTLNGGTLNLDDLKIESGTIGLSEVEVIASVAVDRQTPVAVSTIDGKLIAEQVGNQEFPEILRNTPSIYVTKQGGGFGDSRINVRGFDQRNTAVMINGIPVNDMENGWVYWSNWAGLSDVTSKIQVQRGLGASKLAVASVGGSINIITNAADMRKGGAVGVSVGNDGYQKYSAVASTGLTKSGFAATVQLTHTRGNGYIDGTKFRAHSYFVSLTQKFNEKHMISATYLGAPQWHHQRTVGRFDGVTLRTYVDPDNTGDQLTNMGTRFNHLYGQLNGEEFTWRRNFYHKPKGFVNHYWNISDKVELNTSAYVSFGRGGGTGPRGRIRNDGSIFDTNFRLRNANGQVRWDDIVRYNQGQAIDGWGQKQPQSDGTFATTSDGRFYLADGSRNETGSGFIRRASMNSHNWYGVISNLTAELSEKVTFVGGIDARYYKGIHYRRVENLLGNDAYFSRSDDNNPANFITTSQAAEFGKFADSGYQNTGQAGANVINYYNDGLVRWLGAYGQFEYKTDQLSAFVSFSGSDQSFKRIDYFNYLESDPERETDWQSFLGGTVKTGANYNINERHNVFANVGFFSRQPIFDNVFLNFRNDINPDIENQKITSFELGYGYKSYAFDAKINVYNTVWDNRQFDVTDQNEANQDINYQFRDVAETHRGVEVELTARPVNRLSINGMISIGDWFYNDDFTATGTNLDTQTPEGDLTIFAKDLKVGDAAQTTFSLGARYEIINGLSVNANYYYADRLFAQYDIQDSQFLNPGGEVVQLPNYSLVDAGVSYRVYIGGNDLTFRLNVNNLMNTEYIAELDTNIQDDPTTEINEFYNNRGWFGFGRTWNLGAKFRF